MSRWETRATMMALQQAGAAVMDWDPSGERLSQPSCGTWTDTNEHLPLLCKRPISPHGGRAAHLRLCGRVMGDNRVCQVRGSNEDNVAVALVEYLPSFLSLRAVLIVAAIVVVYFGLKRSGRRTLALWAFTALALGSQIPTCGLTTALTASLLWPRGLLFGAAPARNIGSIFLLILVGLVVLHPRQSTARPGRGTG